MVVVMRGTDYCSERDGWPRSVDLVRSARLFQGRLFAQVNWAYFPIFYKENRLYEVLSCL